MLSLSRALGATMARVVVRDAVARAVDVAHAASASGARALTSTSSLASTSSSSSPPDAADPRAPTPPRRARVDVRDIMRARASAGQDDDIVGHLDDAEDDEDAEDARAVARARRDAAKRKAFHAARGIDVDEIDGPRGLEPTRYGDWERGGRVSDF